MSRINVPSFSNHLPVAIRFGPGVVRQLPEVLEELGTMRWAAVVDPAIAELPAIEQLVRSASATMVVPRGEPTVASVDAVGVALAAAAVQAVVPIGGGSTLDTAKGARIVAEQGGSIARFCWPGEPQPIPVPGTALIAVPTTAGTGSEVTGGVVLADHQRRIKIGAASPNNRAQVALVDPELTLSLPAEPTLYGGLDVVAQAIGAIVATTNTPIGDALALEALRLAAQALPAVVTAPDDLASRTNLACASVMAGLAMNVSEAGSEHSLGHAVGMHAGIPHGLSVAVVLLASMDHDRRVVPEAFERIADTLGEAADGTRDGSRAVRAVAALLDQVGCPTLADLGVADQDISVLSEIAQAGWIPVAPGRWGRQEIEAAFTAALGERRTVSTVGGAT